MAVGRLKKDKVTTSGNTAARPSNPEIGDTHYNGQLGQLEIYNGTSWTAVSAPPLAPTIATPTNASGSDAYSSTGGKLSVVFTKNAVGGEPIQYNAYTTSGGYTAFNSTNTVTITGLTPGTAYTVYGNVQNNFGTSTNSANAAAATPSTKPQAPTIGTASGGNAQSTLTFTAGNSGGSAITNYKYSIDGTTYTAFSPAQTTSPLTISGLTNGTPYAFYLKAVNANGDSTASAQSNSITPLAGVSVDYLVVGGGGSSGSIAGSALTAGGGGAGGLSSTMNNPGGLGTLESVVALDYSTNYTVTVGAGGSVPAWNNQGNPGGNSVFSTITSTGGGGGGRYDNSVGNGGGTGGSGGGGAHVNGTAGARTASPVQGFAGGVGGSTNSEGASGGGGGAGQIGESGGSGTNSSGSGGNGVSVSITGSAVNYAGGGGGGTASNAVVTAGGTGGGGAGAEEGTNGVAGTANTGGGGGGGAHKDGVAYPGGAGGSGVVILRWLTSSASITVGAGLTADSTGTDGSYSYKRFTAGSGNVSFA